MSKQLIQKLKLFQHNKILNPNQKYFISHTTCFYQPIRRSSPYLKKAQEYRLRYGAKTQVQVGDKEIVISKGVNEGQLIKKGDLAMATLSHDALTVVRQLEMLNVFMGFEQSNKYVIYDENAQAVGYVAEEVGFMNVFARQILRTHRPFKATVLDVEGNVMLRIERPFWLINSRIYIFKDDQLIGEVQKEWHLFRRRYNLFIGLDQFARIDAPFLSWDFELQDQDGSIMASIRRGFTGFAREIFTDTGHYSLIMNEGQTNSRGLNLDERAVALAATISLDFDYFSRHSGSHGIGFFPFWGWGGDGDGYGYRGGDE